MMSGYRMEVSSDMDSCFLLHPGQGGQNTDAKIIGNIGSRFRISPGVRNILQVRISTVYTVLNLLTIPYNTIVY